MRRAVFFNLTQIQMPVGAVTSITHRITGILLAIGIPFCIYLLDQSLRNPQSYVWTSRNVVKPNSHWRTTQETTDKGVNYE